MSKPKRAAKISNVAPFPVNTLESYTLAAETLEAQIWNLIIEQVDADFPIDWASGILDRIKGEIQYIDCEGE